jgi:hypothetical protein
MENTTQPIWWERYFQPWSDEHNEFYAANRNNIFTMEKTMNWTDEFDPSIKMEANTRSVTYSGKGMAKTTFTEKF